MKWALFLYLCVCTCMTHAKYFIPRCVAGPELCADTFGGSFLYKAFSYDITIEKNTLLFDCHYMSALDYPALPSYETMFQVSTAEMKNCPPPTNSSYMETLARINVTLQSEGSLVLRLGLEPPLSAQHFTGLENITELTIVTPEYEHAFHVPRPGFLAPFHNLRSLVVENFDFPSTEKLPTTLQTLSITETKLKSLPESFRELTNLRELTLASRGLEAFKTEQRDNTNEKAVYLLPNLEKVTLEEWTEEFPAKLVQCDSLRSFHFTSFVTKILPERWLSACPRLESLHMKYLSVPSLPSNLLEGLSNLVDLEMYQCNFDTLPEGLLHPVPNLRSFQLSGRYHKLPRGIFKQTRALQKVDLSFNNIAADVQDELQELHNLTDLDLSNNNELQNLCDVGGPSKLKNLKNLKSIRLRSTSVSHTCSDWRNLNIDVDMYNYRLQQSIADSHKAP